MGDRPAKWHSNANTFVPDGPVAIPDLYPKLKLYKILHTVRHQMG